MLHALIHDPYPIIAGVSLIEGAVIAILSGVGFAMGYVNPYFAFGLLIAGTFLQDVCYYRFGQWAAKKKKVRDFATRTKFLRDDLLTLETAWKKEMFVTLLMAKLAYGLYVPFVIAAGVSEVPFLRFVAVSLAISAPIIIIWEGVGYGMTRLFGLAHHGTWIASGVGVVGLVIVFFVMRRARRRLNTKKAVKQSHIIESDAKPA
ncbi:MAG: hypothetical protein ACRED9_02305 [Caulobacteraceae bacterium]